MNYVPLYQIKVEGLPKAIELLVGKIEIRMLAHTSVY